MDRGSPAAFASDARGNVAVWFALAALPVVMAAGAAVDYTRAAALRTQLQQATDSALLAIAPLAGSKTDAELRALADGFLQSAMQPALASLGGAAPRIIDFQVSTDRGEVTLKTSADYASALIGAVSSASLITVGALSRTVAGDTTYEIALVLDNSGSMAQSAGSVTKIDATKTAAKALVDALFSTPQSAQRTKVSLVPFTLSVKVGSEYAPAAWVDTGGRSSIHWQNFETPGTAHTQSATWPPQSRFDLFSELARNNSASNHDVTWRGCFESRPGNWGVTDAPPVSPATNAADWDSYFVPQFAPDEPGNIDITLINLLLALLSYEYRNSYLKDDGGSCSPSLLGLGSILDATNAQRKLCKYRGPTSMSTATDSSTGQQRGPNFNCDAQKLLRLSDQSLTIKSAIESMVAKGNTNLFEGFTWGWRTLSPYAPFADGRSYGIATNRKIIVLMTDGVNAWSSINNQNKSLYSPFGYYTNNRIGTSITSQSQARSAMDAKTLQACGNAKASGITVYTVGFTAGEGIDSQGQGLLRQCASTDPESGEPLFFVATNASDLTDIFKKIAQQLNQLRLSR